MYIAIKFDVANSMIEKKTKKKLNLRMFIHLIYITYIYIIYPSLLNRSTHFFYDFNTILTSIQVRPIIGRVARSDSKAHSKNKRIWTKI